MRIEERLEWRRWVTPTLLRDAPIHRWFVFPHSYTGELVETLLKEWSIPVGAYVLDPFAGAGTTAVAAQANGMRALAFDLSPLSVLATRVKTAQISHQHLLQTWGRLEKWLREAHPRNAPRYPELVERALPGKLLPTCHTIKSWIEQESCDNLERDFFMLALLRVIPLFSRLVATGGWLSLRRGGRKADSLPQEFSDRVELMLRDLEGRKLPTAPLARVGIADARLLPLANASVDGVITSPPYANRHDYTRVFGVELMFAFVDEERIKRLRYQSFQSHPEAHPERPSIDGYCEPSSVARLISQVKKNTEDIRVPRMLKGYFADLFYSLKEIARVLRRGGRAAIVLGNVQYAGISFPVDEIAGKLGQRAGLQLERILVARYRGNSAQQMGLYGRRPARESVVMFRKPESAAQSCASRKIREHAALALVSERNGSEGHILGRRT